MLAGHEFDDVYPFCLLQHYLNDKSVLQTVGHLGLSSTSFIPLQECEAERLRGELCSIFADVFCAFFERQQREEDKGGTESWVPSFRAGSCS